MNWMNMIHNESVGGESDVLDTLDQELAMESKIDAEFLESETIALEGVVVKTDEVMEMLGLEAKMPTKDDIVAAGKWLLDKIKELFKKIAAAFNNLRRYGKKAKSNAEEAKKDLMAITVKDNYVDIHALENPEAFVANFDQMVKTIERYKEITEIAKGGMWTAPRGEMRKSGASSFIKELSKHIMVIL